MQHLTPPMIARLRDGETVADRQILRHLARCTVCRVTLDEAMDLARLLRPTAKETPITEVVHPSVEQLAAYLDQILTGRVPDSMTHHLLDCHDCWKEWCALCDLRFLRATGNGNYPSPGSSTPTG